MAYSSYGSQLSTKLSDLESLVDNINTSNISSLWEGKAYNKQDGNLTDVKSSLNQQTKQLNDLILVLSSIDEYDGLVNSIDKYTLERNSLLSTDVNYTTKYDGLTEMINNAVVEKNILKNGIINTLERISNSYTSQYDVISPTEVISTVDVFNNIGEYFEKIDSGFDMNTTVIPFFESVINDSNRMPNFEDTEAWLDKNPYAYSNVGQCTWFAWGRFYEIYGYSPGFTTNGNGCVNQLLKAHGDKFYKSDTPIAGAVFSQGLNEQYGHVGIVLEVDEANDKIVIQDGNYNGSSDSYSVAQNDWGTQTLSLSEFVKKRGGAVFANPIGKEAVMNG